MNLVKIFVFKTVKIFGNNGYITFTLAVKCIILLARILLFDGARISVLEKKIIGKLKIVEKGITRNKVQSIYSHYDLVSC